MNLPGNVQSLTFHQSSKLYIWQPLEAEPGWCEFAHQFSKLVDALHGVELLSRNAKPVVRSFDKMYIIQTWMIVDVTTLWEVNMYTLFLVDGKSQAIYS